MPERTPTRTTGARRKSGPGVVLSITFFFPGNHRAALHREKLADHNLLWPGFKHRKYREVTLTRRPRLGVTETA